MRNYDIVNYKKMENISITHTKCGSTKIMLIDIGIDINNVVPSIIILGRSLLIKFRLSEKSRYGYHYYLITGDKIDPSFEIVTDVCFDGELSTYVISEIYLYLSQSNNPSYIIGDYILVTNDLHSSHGYFKYMGVKYSIYDRKSNSVGKVITSNKIIVVDIGCRGGCKCHGVLQKYCSDILVIGNVTKYMKNCSTVLNCGNVIINSGYVNILFYI